MHSVSRKLFTLNVLPLQFSGSLHFYKLQGRRAVENGNKTKATLSFYDLRPDLGLKLFLQNHFPAILFGDTTSCSNACYPNTI